MKTEHHSPSAATLCILLSCVFEVSCTAIREDRSLCPCALTVEVTGLPAWPVYLSLTGENFQMEMDIPQDSCFTVDVPRSGVRLLALSGATPGPEGVLRFPEGSAAPELYLHTEKVETAGETARVKARLHKQFCTLSLTYSSPAEWDDLPYWIALRGNVNGLSLAGEPLHGPFSCRLSPDKPTRIPRQLPLDELWLEVTLSDRVLRSFALGHYMMEAGYDWYAPDLEDLSIEIHCSLTALNIRSRHWGVCIPLKLEI